MRISLILLTLLTSSALAGTVEVTKGNGKMIDAACATSALIDSEGREPVDMEEAAAVVLCDAVRDLGTNPALADREAAITDVASGNIPGAKWSQAVSSQRCQSSASGGVFSDAFCAETGWAIKSAGCSIQPITSKLRLSCAGTGEGQRIRVRVKCD